MATDASASGDLAGAPLDGAPPPGVDLATMPPDLTTPLDLAPTPRDLAFAGFLNGSHATGPVSISLTNEGTRDWFHCGLASAADFNHKNGGGSQVTETVNGAPAQYTTYASKFSWTDGTPTASATDTTNGIYVFGPSSFTVVAPADRTTRTLRLYLNTLGSASLTAHLSDGSAADYNDTATNGNVGATVLYTLQYASANPGSLTITWTAATASAASLIAATLQ